MFKNRLSLLRKQKNISQYTLAQQLGLSRGQIGNYEQGTRQPDYEVLSKIADYFDVTTDYLLGRADDPRPKIETIAAHRTDDPLSELPEEARRSVDEFIEYVKEKYKKK